MGIFLQVNCHNMRLLITMLFFAFVLASCRKNKPLFDGQSCTGNCYVLTGKLLEKPGNLPLQNNVLKFYYRPGGYTIFNSTKYLGKTTTGPDGSFLFNFDSKDFKIATGYFRIEGSRDGYIYSPFGEKIDKDLLIFYLDSSKINIPQVYNLNLYRAATLKFRIRASTITNFDFLTVTYNFGANGFGPALNGNRVIDTTLVYKTAADVPTFINWDALGNGVNIRRKDTIVVRAGTEQTYQIAL
ncbi:MAG: hypothetical protein ABI707_06425 [Ferruginibacter sp.]